MIEKLCANLVSGEKSVTYNQFSYYHIHHGLTREKFGSEGGRLAPLAPLPTIEATIQTENNFLFSSPGNCFVTPYTIFLVPRTPTRCYISYRFRGSPSLLTPHPLPISNYASASLFWKSTGSSRFPNRAHTLQTTQGVCVGRCGPQNL